MFPKCARTTIQTRADVRDLTIRLRDRYFEGGGMLLSESGRDKNFAPQQALGGLPTTGDGGPLDEATYERLRQRCSDLRSALVQDVGTRREPVVADEEH
jgi:hypothetical protein